MVCDLVLLGFFCIPLIAVCAWFWFLSRSQHHVDDIIQGHRAEEWLFDDDDDDD